MLIRIDSDNPLTVDIRPEITLNGNRLKSVGGADGPTVIAVTQSRQGEVHMACSSPLFEPVDSVTWRITFHEKLKEDICVELI